MNFKKNILLSTMIAGGIITAVVTPIAILSNISNNNQQNNLVNKNFNQSVNNKETFDFNNLSIKNSSYDNYLDNHYDINKINKNNLLKMINQKINNIQNNTSKTGNFAEIQNNSNLLKEKTNQIINDLYNGKVTIKDLINKIYSNYNKMSQSNKDFIVNQINNHKSKNEESIKQQIGKYISTQPISMISAQSNYYNTLSNTTNKVLILNSISTTAATAATAVAAAVWAIPFYGWMAEGGATAGAAADWACVGVSWGQYVGLNNQKTEIAQLIFNNISIYSTIYDVYTFAHDLFSFLVNSGNTVLESILTNLGIQSATSWADPEVDAWYIPAISGIQLAIDSTMTITGIMSGIYN